MIKPALLPGSCYYFLLSFFVNWGGGGGLWSLTQNTTEHITIYNFITNRDKPDLTSQHPPQAHPHHYWPDHHDVWWAELDIFTKCLQEFPHCATLSIKLCWASQTQHHQLGQNKNSDFPNLLGAPPNFLFIFTEFVDYNRKVASAQYIQYRGTQLFLTHQDWEGGWSWPDHTLYCCCPLVSLYFV